MPDSDSPNPKRSLGGLLSAAMPDLRRWILRRRGVEKLGGESIGDLIQSVCREALEAKEGFEDRGDPSFTAWLQTLTDRKLADRARHWSAARREAARRTSLGEEDLVEEQSGPEEEALRKDLVERVLSAIGRLPRDQADVLRLQLTEGLGTAEIAERLGKSAGAVRVLRSRGLATLAQQLDDSDQS